MSKKGGIKMDNRPIGMFDSGVGGLTVLKEVMKKSIEKFYGCL